MPEKHIAAIRAFNRFYTRIIGVLNESMMQSPFPLAEARLIHEIGKRKHTSAGELARDLDIDAGQLSRLVWRLSDQGLLASTPNPNDKRANNLSLTPDGDSACAELNTMSDAAVVGLTETLGDVKCQNLVKSMQTIQSTLGGEMQKSALVLRPHRVGELGWLIHRQAVLYNQEYGWNSAFEALIAKIYADFETVPATAPKALWVAEQNDEIAGSVFIVPAEAQKQTAQLRMLYVEPSVRGNGVGGKLVEEAVMFAKSFSYKRITLWTQDCLTSARKIYRAAGFKLVSEGKHHSFGHDLNGQYWERDLTSN